MSGERESPLPEHRNPLLAEEKAPQHDILVERRCLGQTELKVKPGQVGITNATKADNLGVLDYAHLRVPLPKDLSSSGIFSKGANRKYPEAYFLMRRSSDGFVSATGMFKAAFPYAQQEDEAAEKEHVKSLKAASSEEVAGNVWIAPESALELAEEYGIRLWVAALLDPEAITHGTDASKNIRSPPPFRSRDTMNGAGRTPGKKRAAAESRPSTRSGRAGTRSVSPVAAAQAKTPGRAIKTPGGTRGRRKGKGAVAGEDGTESVNGEATSKLEPVQETVKVEVETTTRLGDGDDEEPEATKINIEMPAGHADLPMPEDPEAMLREARRMVAEANKIGGSSRSEISKGKRKAEEMIDEDDEVGLNGPSSIAKRARVAEIQSRKQRIALRAMGGMIASAVIAALIPSITAAFGA